MSENNEGIIVILSSPSGAGKTTLVKEISKEIIFKYQYLIQQENLVQTKQMVKIIILSASLNLKI